MKKLNICFLTLYDIESIDNHGIYEDLLRELYKKGHNLYVVSPSERRKNINTQILHKENCTILKVKTGNIQKTNIFEKGIATLRLESQYVKVIKKYFSNIKFDLILYSTPPITLVNAINYLKKRDNAKTYLMLKDIFPQNAVDLGMLSKHGLKSLIYKYFRNKEKKLYELSDTIGCMSQANVDYVMKNNIVNNSKNIEIFPNCIEPRDLSINGHERIKMREKYGIPIDKIVLVYGGNLGKPQGIDFLINCLKSQKDNYDLFFLIVGDGTEYSKIDEYGSNSNQKNLKLLKRLPKEDYDRMIGSCDIGMIFLDNRFTIPNFPSRLLSYMQAKLPVLAVTDSNTDIGTTVVNGKFGWWCQSNNIDVFKKLCNQISQNKDNLNIFRENSINYLYKNYDVSKNVELLIK